MRWEAVGGIPILSTLSQEEGKSRHIHAFGRFASQKFDMFARVLLLHDVLPEAPEWLTYLRVVSGPHPSRMDA